MNEMDSGRRHPKLSAGQRLHPEPGRVLSCQQCVKLVPVGGGVGDGAGDGADGLGLIDDKCRGEVGDGFERGNFLLIMVQEIFKRHGVFQRGMSMGVPGAIL